MPRRTPASGEDSLWTVQILFTRPFVLAWNGAISLTEQHLTDR